MTLLSFDDDWYIEVKDSFWDYRIKILHYHTGPKYFHSTGIYTHSYKVISKADPGSVITPKLTQDSGIRVCHCTSSTEIYKKFTLLTNAYKLRAYME